jgi:hypothetical protein
MTGGPHRLPNLYHTLGPYCTPALYLSQPWRHAFSNVTTRLRTPFNFYRYLTARATLNGPSLSKGRTTPQQLNVEKRLSKMLAKQESLLSALQSLAETHGGDGEGERARTAMMTWASTLEALENARDALDDLVDTVHYAAVAEAEEKASTAAAG